MQEVAFLFFACLAPASFVQSFSLIHTREVTGGVFAPAIMQCFLLQVHWRSMRTRFDFG